MDPPVTALSSVRPRAAVIDHLRDLALRGLARMYRQAEGRFAFRLRRRGEGLTLEGSSVRYTAIALIGLAGEDEEAQALVLAGTGIKKACSRLVGEVASLENLGDVALVLWAASAAGCPEPRPVIERLLALAPGELAYPTVEVAWTLAALSADGRPAGGALRERLARRLIQAFRPRSGMFPHILGRAAGGFRGHVSCFADLVYPIHALARYAELSGNAEARDVALSCAEALCRRQGSDGQWWWHYDVRTGDVVERYPVYAVHQDAMAPMVLLALEPLVSADLRPSIVKGLAWLTQAPELGGASLIDERAGLIWRKVARREPGKLSRYAQAAASSLHPSFRVPGLGRLLPPRVVDYEDRPYHLGWLLHAWPPGRAARWEDAAIPQ
jgi:hypothetical protein